MPTLVGTDFGMVSMNAEKSYSRNRLASTQKILIAGLVGLLICGCASVNKNDRLSKSVKVCIHIKTSEVLFSSIVSERSVNGVGIRIKKYLDKKLARDGITSDSSENWSEEDAQVTVDLNTIETVTKNKPGPFFSTIVYQHVVIKYSARLVTKDGVKLFEFNGHEHEESIDDLAKTIGVYLAKRIAKCYQ